MFAEEFHNLNRSEDFTPKYRNLLNSKEEDFEFLARILDLAGNPIRLKMLYLLANEDNICVNRISEILDISVSSTSQHLRKLKDCGILKCKKEKQTVFYYVSPKYKDKIPMLFNLLD